MSGLNIEVTIEILGHQSNEQGMLYLPILQHQLEHQSNHKAPWTK